MTTPGLLSEGEIRALITATPPLLEGYLDLDAQLQPAGFDVTVQRLVKPSGRGTLGGPYRTKIPTELDVELSDIGYRLDVGFYIVYLNEVTRLPADVAGVALPRSSLFRCGAALHSGVWDPGFHGRGRLGLHVINSDGLVIEHQAPFAQLMFYRLSQQTKGFQFNEFYGTD